MTSQHLSQTWIITGASRGIGRALAETVLAADDQVVAAVRRTDSVADLVSIAPDRCVALQYDAADTDSAEPLVQAAAARFDRIDVVVNNAGRGLIGAAEEIGESDLRELMDLHFFGPVALTKAALPLMRTQRSGTIIQLSSQGGRLAFGGVSAYCATKFALEGWSEALVDEVAPHGIRVMIVEPSRFRTNFNAPGTLQFAAASQTYSGQLDEVRRAMADADGVQQGDPMKAAGIIVALVHGDRVPLRLPLGAEAVTRISDAYRRGLSEVDRWAAVARSADFDGPHVTLAAITATAA